MPVLPERLRLAREKAGLTQLQLGDLIGGKGPDQVSRWETGSFQPRLETLIELARILQVSLDYLTGLSDDPGSGSELRSTDALSERERDWEGDERRRRDRRRRERRTR